MRKVKVVGFVVVFCGLFVFVSLFFRPMNDGWGSSVIYYEPHNTIDVLFVGSSHIFANINPSILWREQGIASFDYAGSTQTIWNSYYYICEALKYQTPSLVILDVLTVSMKFGNDFTDYPRQIAYSTFLPSLNKLSMVEAGAEPENRLPWLIDLLFYHTRWKNMTANELPVTRENYLDKNAFKYKGYGGGVALVSNEHSAELNTVAYPSTDALLEIPEKNLLYLMKIIALSKEKGFKLVLVKTPTPQMSFETASNTIKKIADENNIDFIDFHYNHHRDAMGLDYTTDYMDAAHLNISGAEKLSKYVAKILKENYDIPDRRGDSRYKSWNDAANKYSQHKAMEKAKLSTDLPSYITALKDVSQDLIFITSVKDEASEKIGPINGSLSPFGITADFTGKYMHSYISVYEVSSGYLYEAISDKRLEKAIYKDEFPINVEVVSAGQPVGNNSSIKIDGTEYSKNQRGLNIVIYDKVSETVFDSFSVDTCGDETYAIKR